MSAFVIEDNVLDWHSCQIWYPLEIKLLLLLLYKVEIILVQLTLFVFLTASYNIKLRPVTRTRFKCVKRLLLEHVLCSTSYATSFRRRFFPYHHAVNHPHTNITLSWFSISLFLKYAANILKIGLQIKIKRPQMFLIGIVVRRNC